MLNLHNLNIDLEKAKQEHFNYFKPMVKKKLARLEHYPFLREFLTEKDHLDLLILGLPEELHLLNNLFIQQVDKFFSIGTYDAFISLSKEKRKKCTHPISEFMKELDKIINYKELGNDNHYNSYNLTKNLDVRSCIYCNRMYTLTQRTKNKKRLMSPQLDHWFPQSKYPLLQISFHNLLPSCEICNSRVKNDIQLNLNDHFHPFSPTDKNEKLVFSYRPKVNNEYSIYFKNNPISTDKIKNTMELLFVDQMYNAHQEELEDLIKIEKAYSKSYLDTFSKIIPGFNLNKDEVYRLAFGTEIKDTNFHKRPLSKFKHDILTELGIIN